MYFRRTVNQHYHVGGIPINEIFCLSARELNFSNIILERVFFSFSALTIIEEGRI